MPRARQRSNLEDLYEDKGDMRAAARRAEETGPRSHEAMKTRGERSRARSLVEATSDPAAYYGKRGEDRVCV